MYIQDCVAGRVELHRADFFGTLTEAWQDAARHIPTVPAPRVQDLRGGDSRPDLAPEG